jgi:hypothetical protein
MCNVIVVDECANEVNKATNMPPTKYNARL